MNNGTAADLFARLEVLSTPRPNGSRALDGTIGTLRRWLEAEGLVVVEHRFTLRPYFMELLGIGLALGGLLLAVTAIARWGWAGPVVAFTLVALPVLETRFLMPTITALISRPAQNLVVQFAAPHPEREVVLCAHVDSKTELLDHAARDRLLRWGRPAMILALGCGALVVVESQLPHGAVRAIIHAAAVGMALPAVAYGLGMGANLAGGRMRRRPSRGAVDNGAAVAVLLDLARRLQRGDPALKHTAVTLLLTVGEEVQMQGALAYVDDRTAWPLPTCVVNLDSVGQDGGYLLYAEDGTVMYRLPADPGIVGALGTAVEAVNGTQPPVAPSTNTDAFAFLRRGIPAATLGSFDAELGKRGLHGPLDNPDRVDRQRLVETVGILSRFLVDVDTSPVDA